MLVKVLVAIAALAATASAAPRPAPISPVSPLQLFKRQASGCPGGLVCADDHSICFPPGGSCCFSTYTA